MSIPQLLKAAQQNHGRTLTPAEVQEIAQTIIRVDTEAQSLHNRLLALQTMTNVLIDRVGGAASITAAELTEAEDNGGFEIEWDEETDVITIRRTPVAMSAVLVEDDAAEAGEPGLALVPEEGDGVAESSSS